MKMIRNMAFYYGGKFYATQGGPVRLGYSVSEAQLPAVWDTEVVTNYPQRISKDTIQFTLIDSQAPGITGSLSDFSPDDADALCAKDLRLYTVIGDETTGSGCSESDGTQKLGALCVRQASAYVTTVAPSSITVDGERVETLAVTFRTTTPFARLTTVPALVLPVYEAQYVAPGFACENAELDDADYEAAATYGEDMPAITATNVAIGAVISGKTFAGLADSEGKLYYSHSNVAEAPYVAVIEKWDRLLPVPLYYKYIAS